MEFLNADDLEALALTAKLALTVTVILMSLGIPLAWWLSKTPCRWKGGLEALIALPLFLPPSVIGFYFLLAMSPNGPIGYLTERLGMGYLPFTFQGLVVTSILYSMPFVVQPLKSTFMGINPRLIEAAATLGASPLDVFFTIVLPLSRSGLMTAAVLGFAHTVGEFGIVLMIGGNIPGQTRLASVQIYDHVEALDYLHAHWLSGVMLLFSFLVLLALYTLNPDRQGLWGRS
ncbi:MAG TPA: molybdate ABC transporter permease subunit [Methylococcaceae bacterium]|jgi:molybdate transport system permease protein|nr:molybdate ABC transporter permease subunit [Methylococcaceae bacterium]